MIKSSALYCCRPRSTWGGSVPTLVLGKCCRRDATPALTGFETGVEQIRRDGVNERAKQGVVQSTDQAGDWCARTR